MIGLLSIFAYVVATAMLVSGLMHDRTVRISAALWLAALATVGHFVFLVSGLTDAGSAGLSFFTTLSLVAWLIAALTLLGSLRWPVRQLLLIALPGAGLWLLAQILAAPAQIDPSAPSGTMLVHIAASLLAFSVLSIAALNAMLIAIQDAVLRRHRLPALFAVLPPLALSEALLFQLLWAGWLLLCVSLATGLLFVENLMAQHLAHKTILSIIAWLVFGTLLAGRIRFGWRGLRAVRLTLLGMAVLLLAYFGSRAILELVLDRSWTG